MEHAELIFTPGSDKKLIDFSTDYTGKYMSKKAAEKDLEKGIIELSKLQDMLYAND